MSLFLYLDTSTVLDFIHSGQINVAKLLVVFTLITLFSFFIAFIHARINAYLVSANDMPEEIDDGRFINDNKYFIQKRQEKKVRMAQQKLRHCLRFMV